MPDLNFDAIRRLLDSLQQVREEEQITMERMNRVRRELPLERQAKLLTEDLRQLERLAGLRQSIVQALVQYMGAITRAALPAADVTKLTRFLILIKNRDARALALMDRITQGKAPLEALLSFPGGPALK